METGYIKYNCNLINNKDVINDDDMLKINSCRDVLYDLSLIGVYKNGIGFGNISIKTDDSSKFTITGSSTGQYERLEKEHFAKVTSCDLESNNITCEGLINASSESLTHDAIYKANYKIKAVIHVHNFMLWNKLLFKVPTTALRVEYGTKEMAKEFTRILSKPENIDKGIIVMGGHEEGIITFGENLNKAKEILMNHYYNRIYL